MQPKTTLPNSTRNKRVRITAALVALGFIGALLPSVSQAQALGIPDPEPVDYRGQVDMLDTRSGIMSIETATENVFADFNRIRRLRNGAVVSGIPVPRVTVYDIHSTRVLEKSMRLMFIAKLLDKKETVDPVRDFTIVSELPTNGMIIPPKAESEVAESEEDEAVDGASDDGDAKDAGAEEPIREYLVIGEVTTTRPDSITVTVPTPTGERKVRVQLAEDSFLRRQTNDLSLVTVGDQLRVVGQMIEPPFFYATELVAVHRNRLAPPVEYDVAIRIPQVDDVTEEEVNTEEEVRELPRGSDPFNRSTRMSDPLASDADSKTDSKADGETKPPKSGSETKIFYGKLVRVN